MPRPLTRQELKRRARATAAAEERRGNARLRDAIEAFKELDVAEALKLVRHVAETRTPELLKAYPDLRHIGYGFKRRTHRGTFHVHTQQPCVTLVVRRKWPKKRPAPKGAARRALPKYLFAYAMVNGRDILCAVRTDVIESWGYRPRGGGVIVAEGGRAFEAGVVCCFVRTPSNDRRIYALGCHHVFTGSKSRYPFLLDTQLYHSAVSPANMLGDLSGYIGDMEAYPPFSLDAALVEITDYMNRWAGLADCVPKTARVSSFATTDYRICTPDGPLDATLNNFLPTFDGISYAVPGVMQMNLYEMRVYGRIADGYSGSPVFEKQDGSFAGMLLATNSDGSLGLVLPANQLLSAARYHVVAPDADATLRVTWPPDFPL